MEWLVSPQVLQTGQTGLGLLSFWLFVLFALVLTGILILELQFFWPLLFCQQYSCFSGLGLFLNWVDGTGSDSYLVFLHRWHVKLGFSEFCCAACCVTVFICSSSGASKPFSSNSLPRCDTICSYVPFSKCAWLIDFFRWGGLLVYMNCSMIAWAATPSASFASFWSSSKKSINFWFAGLKTSRWNLCFAVAIDWGFTYFLRNTVRISPNFSLKSPWGWCCLWMFVEHHHAWENESSSFCFLLSVGCGISNLFGTDIHNSSNFSDFQSKVGIVVGKDLDNFESLFMLLLKLCELLFMANY